MRGVDNRRDPLVTEMPHESFNAAEAADSHGDGLHGGHRGAAGQRQRGIEALVAREQAGEGRGFGGAAEEENAHG